MNNKIINLKDLAAQCASFRKQGKKIALCHGCFDLLHPGHIKHFEAAKNLADVLIVTVTDDKFVKKGPGRPVFNDQLRMESIASLQAVDYVALNKWNTAIETIKLLKPDFYVKGQDYKNMDDDLTGNIKKEKEAVLSCGGKIHFTEEITFSSSNLINAHFSPLGEKVQDYLLNFKKRFSKDSIVEQIEKLKDIKILVIGDTIIDEYHYCIPLGKSSKSPTISTIFLREETFAGGVLAIANHVNQFAGKVEVLTCLGLKDTKEDFINSKLSPEIKTHFFYRKDGPTPVKRRYLDKYLDIKLFEVTFMNDNFVDIPLEKEIKAYLDKVSSHYDLILIADFGHGFISPAIKDKLVSFNKFKALNAQTNSNNYGFNYVTKYNKVDYISIDEKELRLPFGDNYGRIEDLIKHLQKITRASQINITLGQQGSIYFNHDNFIHTPAFASAVKDSVGAGDAVLSVTALCAYKKMEPEIISFIGNCMGALAVEIIGNAKPVFKKDLIKFITHFLK